MREPRRQPATPTSNGFELTVVIATSGRSDLLERSLQYLSACDKPSGYRETVVVENGGRRDVQRIVESFQSELSARYLYSNPANKSSALNMAVDTLGNSLVVFTDDDVRCNREFLVHYARAAGETTVSAFFGGPLGIDYERQPPEYVLNHMPASARGWEAETVGGEPVLVGVRGTPLFLGINWAAYSSDIRAAGGFDVHRGPEEGSVPGEETAMQNALLRAGRIAIYVPEAKVWHYVPAERAIPEWVLDRTFKHGASRGRETAQEARFRAGPLLWVASRILRTSVRRMLARLDGRPERLFDAAAKRQYNRGLVAGVRYFSSGGRP